MGDHSGIQWTDASWNPSTGCTRVSAGCDHCYAFTLHDQRYAAHLAGKDVPPQYHRPFAEVQLLDSKRLTLPLRWTKPRKIFVNSMSDLFHADVPTEFIAEVFAVMALAPQHTFQVLTKRPQRMKRLLSDLPFWAAVADAGLRRFNEWPKGRILPEIGPDKPLPNVWLGTSVENQEAAYRIDWLVKTPAAVRFLSCEPLLGPLTLWRPCPEGPHYDGGYCNVCVNDYQEERFGTYNPLESGLIDWVIVGGESGPDFRAVDPDWVRNLREETREHGGAFFFKQWGGRTAKAGGRELDGRTWDEMPQVPQAA